MSDAWRVVTCEQCGRTHRCTPDDDHYLRSDGKKVCITCLTGPLEVVTMSVALTCAHCGADDVGASLPGGYGFITFDGRPAALCHPNATDRPDCYHLVTVYHEELGSRRPR